MCGTTTAATWRSAPRPPTTIPPAPPGTGRTSPTPACIVAPVTAPGSSAGSRPIASSSRARFGGPLLSYGLGLALEPPFQLGQRQLLHLDLRGRQRRNHDDLDAGAGIDRSDAHLGADLGEFDIDFAVPGCAFAAPGRHHAVVVSIRPWLSNW